MESKRNIGRNSACPCGSGKKYKKCCLPSGRFEEGGEPLPKEFLEQQDAINRGISYKATHLLREPDYKGHPISPQDYRGRELGYVERIMGRGWFSDQLRKKPGKRHPIINWYAGMRHFQQKLDELDDDIFSIVPNGPFRAYIQLAWDLYTVRLPRFQQRIFIDRLKNPGRFQRARYELFAAATCVRAGFITGFKNEPFRKGKQPEFIAEHYTHDLISIRAVCGQRSGFLSYIGKKKDNVDEYADVQQLLNSATREKPERPYVIFVDVNLPGSDKPVLEDAWCNDLVTNVVNTGNKNDNTADPFNLILFTNHQFNRSDENTEALRSECMDVMSLEPEYAVRDEAMLMAIVRAAKNYEHIPEEFRDVE